MGIPRKLTLHSYTSLASADFGGVGIWSKGWGCGVWGGGPRGI